MTTKQMAIPEQLTVTLTKIWQRCSQPKPTFVHKLLNQAMGLLLAIVTLLTLAVVATLAWQQVMEMNLR